MREDVEVASLAGPHGSGRRSPALMAGAILAVVSEKDEQGGTLHAAVALARRLGTRLSVVGIPLRPPFGVACAPIAPPISYSTLRQENIDRIQTRCRELAQGVPHDVPVEYRVLHGRRARVVNSLLERGAFGAVVMQDDWMRRPLMRKAARRWRGEGVAVYAASEATRAGTCVGPVGGWTYP